MKRTLMLLLVAAGAALTAGPVSATQSVSQTLGFGAGWTLSGNGLKKSLPVAELFGTKDTPIAGVSDVVVTVWQWDGTNSKWLFFAPSMAAAALESYAQSKGYGVLTSIAPGSGFWVNAKSPVTLSGTHSGAPATMTVDDLPERWSLNAVYSPITPAALNASSSFMPPQPGETTVSFVTLWAWDSVTMSWFFYAPSLDSAALANYISSKGYLDFLAGNMKLQSGVGFWVNKAGDPKDTPPEIFPSGMAVAAPTAAPQAPTTGGTPQAPTTGGTPQAPATGGTPQAPATGGTPSGTGAVQTQMAQAAGQISSVLNETASFKSIFNPGQMMMSGGNSNCFGPSVQYSGYPGESAGSPIASGNLPSGDLGIWSASDADGSACASATLEMKMSGVSARTNTALVSLAGMLVEAKKASKLPSPGSTSTLTDELNALAISSVTFTSATLGLDSTGDVWSYRLAFTYTDNQNASHEATLNLTHTAAAADPRSKYSGVMQWSVTDANNGGGCSAADVTRLGSLKYVRNSSSDLTYVQRDGTYCNKLPTADIAANYATDLQLDPTTAWSGGFSRFGATFDPTSLDGYYGYGWQAGKGDNYARIFAVSIDGSTQDGSAWFGFGDDISVSDGSIKGFFCNWAGPGNIKNPMPQYAQRQTIKLNTALTPGKWQAQVSNIRYAPTNSCTYTGSGFWYDRDLNQANNETASDINVTGSETDFLYQRGAGDATITDTIKATGMTFPAF